jgi:hypothetical protein
VNIKYQFVTAQKFSDCGVSPDHIVTDVILSLRHIFNTHGNLHIPSPY